MENNSNQSVFSELKTDIIEYIELKSDLTKLSLYEIISKAGASIISALSLIIMTFFFLFFLFLSLGFYLSKLLDSLYFGFGIISLFYLFLLLIYLAIRKKHVERPIMNKIIESLTENYEPKN